MNLYEAVKAKGLIVQCMHCWWIQGDDGAWEPYNELLGYASHGICLTCLDSREEYQDIKHKVSVWQQARAQGLV